MILDNVFFLCVAIVVIEVFNEFRINNYGRILDRFFYLFNVRNIFNTIKISSFLAFLIILFFKNVNYFKDINLIVEKLDILELNYIPAIAFTLITIVFRYERLKTEFGYSFTTNSSIIVNLKYIIFRLVSFVFVFYVFKYVFIGIYQLDSYFLVNKMNIFDWYNNELINKSLLFKKGVYFSSVIVISFFFLINNGFLKINSSYGEEKNIKLDFIKYLFVSFVLCIGLFLSIYSILNAFYSINNSSLKDFISYDNIFGILPIRFASIIILYNFLIYFYKNVLEEKIVYFIVICFIPLKLKENYSKKSIFYNPYSIINFNDRETLYFSQISFYIINIAISEIAYINNIKSVYFSLLNIIILFIIDDFTIINSYSRGFTDTMKWHVIRIFFANLLMFISSIILLSSSELFMLLIIYLLFSILLSFIYFSNFDKIIIGIRNEKKSRW
nr:hypothetical protein [uncultured Flavobacterium sp.]